MSHRGSGRGPNTVADASHLDAADLARAVAMRHDPGLVTLEPPCQGTLRAGFWKPDSRVGLQSLKQDIDVVFHILGHLEARRRTPTGSLRLENTTFISYEKDWTLPVDCRRTVLKEP